MRACALIRWSTVLCLLSPAVRADDQAPPPPPAPGGIVPAITDVPVRFVYTAVAARPEPEAVQAAQTVTLTPVPPRPSASPSPQAPPQAVQAAPAAIAAPAAVVSTTHYQYQLVNPWLGRRMLGNVGARLQNLAVPQMRPVLPVPALFPRVQAAPVQTLDVAVTQTSATPAAQAVHVLTAVPAPAEAAEMPPLPSPQAASKHR
jgi:hypothetical protein